MRVTPTILLAAICLTPKAALAGGLSVIPYQGQLKLSGEPYTGVVDVRASVWNTSVGGEQLAPTVEAPLTEVTDGLFTVEIDQLPQGLYEQGFWIEIEIEGQTLAPRQRYWPAPQSIQSVGAALNDAGGVTILPGVTEFDAVVVGADFASSLSSTGSFWQSFVADETFRAAGFFMQVTGTEGVPVLVRFYEGQGTDGRCISEQQVVSSMPFSLEERLQGPTIPAGVEHTIEIVSSDPSSTAVLFANDPMSELASSLGPGRVIGLTIYGRRPGEALVAFTDDGGLEIGSENGAPIRIDHEVANLPADSIDATETSHEPGMYSELIDAYPITTASARTIAIPSIVTPGAGFVVARQTGEIEFDHVQGIGSRFVVGLGPDFRSFFPSATTSPATGPESPSGTKRLSYSHEAVFRVLGPGRQDLISTVMKSDAASPDATIIGHRVSLTYYPTQYGTLDVNAELPAP